MAVRPPLAEQLDLLPHPEGGWFRQTWRSPVSFSPEGYVMVTPMPASIRRNSGRESVTTLPGAGTTGPR